MNAAAKLSSFFLVRWNIYLWQKANSLNSRDKPKEALEIYLRLNLPMGLKQIALVQMANMFLRIADNQGAKQYYMKAIESERNWGKREYVNNSKYLIEYCRLFQSVIEGEETNGEAEVNFALKADALRKIEVSGGLNKYYLSLPRCEGNQEHWHQG